MQRKFPFAFTGHVLSLSLMGVRFALGQFHPSTKEFKNLPVYHHSLLPHHLEAINSGSRYRTAFSNISMACPFVLTHFVL